MHEQMDRTETYMPPAGWAEACNKWQCCSNQNKVQNSYYVKFITGN